MTVTIGPHAVRRVLVTGATGFVGARVMEALAQQPDLEIIGLARRAPPEALRLAGVRWLQADVLDEAGMQAVLREVRPGVLLHAAWYVEHGKFWDAPENQHWLEASLALIAHFYESGGRRVVGLGTCAEYATDGQDSQYPWREDRAVLPTTPYGIAKAQLASALFDMAARGTAREAAWARLFHLFGPGEHPARLVPSVIASLQTGQPARCGPGDLVRDFASTWFVGSALAALLSSGVTGAVNVASGVPTTLAALVGHIAALLAREDLLQVGALPGRPGEVPTMVANIDRLRHDVGFHEQFESAVALRRLVAEAG